MTNILESVKIDISNRIIILVLVLLCLTIICSVSVDKQTIIALVMNSDGIFQSRRDKKYVGESVLHLNIK